MSAGVVSDSRPRVEIAFETICDFDHHANIYDFPLSSLFPGGWTYKDDETGELASIHVRLKISKVSE